MRKLVIHHLEYSQARDLNPTTGAKLSSGLTHVEGTHLKFNPRCFVTDKKGGGRKRAVDRRRVMERENPSGQWTCHELFFGQWVPTIASDVAASLFLRQMQRRIGQFRSASRQYFHEVICTYVSDVTAQRRRRRREIHTAEGRANSISMNPLIAGF